MTIGDFVDKYIDYKDDVYVELYSYDCFDTIYKGEVDKIPEEYLYYILNGLEFPGTNHVVINCEANHD